jgi:hypothetical protein
MLDKLCTIYPNIVNTGEFAHITIAQALERIKNGKKARNRVLEIRKAKSKDEADQIKKTLPSVCFSGKFEANRKDNLISEHSGFMILDFDDVKDPENKKKELFELPYAIASWLSPRATGVKVLVRIADGKRHREHFEALRDIMPEIDRTGINVARVCFESYDPDILIKETCEPFTKYKIVQTYQQKQNIEVPQNEVYQKLLTWLTNSNEAFINGNRNRFIYKLASACCRFGMSKSDCQANINYDILSKSTEFSQHEAEQAINSAYRSNQANSAHFTKDVLVNRVDNCEVKIDDSIYDLEEKAKDVIFGEDVKEDALNLLRYGHVSASPLYMGELDSLFKWKKGEITLLTGIGNYGKSTFLKYLMLLQVVCENKKFALYAPEDFPAHEFYHELVEIYWGSPCLPFSLSRPDENLYSAIYDFIADHFFFVYPKENFPTPSYIRARFLELIIKKKVDFCVIDPFNQLSNAEQGVARDDQYIGRILSEYTQFARENDQCFVIVAHPTKEALRAGADGNFPRPNTGMIAGGAMWNNKMDNILVYHRPFRQTDPESTICQIESLKIRRQKVVGKIGMKEINMDGRSKRYVVDGVDYLEMYIKDKAKETDKKIVEEYADLPEFSSNPLDLAAKRIQGEIDEENPF